MLKIKWLARATANLENERRFIAKDNPQASIQVLQQVFDTVEHLSEFPYIGKSGRINGTREFNIPKLPYIVIYSIDSKFVRIHRILHTRRQYPPSKS